jgi:hypothetical protein
MLSHLTRYICSRRVFELGCYYLFLAFRNTARNFDLSFSGVIRRIQWEEIFMNYLRIKRQYLGFKLLPVDNSVRDVNDFDLGCQVSISDRDSNFFFATVMRQDLGTT